MSHNSSGMSLKRTEREFANLPSVSVLTLTYGRPSYLAEAVASFLSQDYPGPMEMIVLNDFVEQQIVCNSPNVRVVNAEQRFPSIGSKRNHSVSLAQGEIILTLDDDDLILPHHVRNCVGLLADLDFVEPQGGYTLLHHNSRIVTNDGVMPQLVVFRKSIWQRCGGYPNDANCGEDKGLLARLREHGQGARKAQERPSYLFSWDNGADHLEGYAPDDPLALEVIRQNALRRLAAGEMTRGIIEIVPSLHHDYEAMVAALPRAVGQVDLEIELPATPASNQPPRRLRLNPAIVAAEVGEELVLLNVDTGANFELNPLAAIIWESLLDQDTEEDILEELRATFDVDPMVLRQDIESFVDSLLAHSLAQIDRD
ncbi:MAG: PqqD family peptide modification chaperone [Chloroflexota bacterium]